MQDLRTFGELGESLCLQDRGGAVLRLETHLHHSTERQLLVTAQDPGFGTMVCVDILVPDALALHQLLGRFLKQVAQDATPSGAMVSLDRVIEIVDRHIADAQAHAEQARTNDDQLVDQIHSWTAVALDTLRVALCELEQSA